MSAIPRDSRLDSTFDLLREGYLFIGNRCRRYQSDVFETRLMLRRVICTVGEDAARMFYQPERFTRQGAMPLTALLSLQDKGSVQTLDGAAHRQRKQMFMSLMTPARIQQLVALMVAQWQQQLTRWTGEASIVLHPAVQFILCRAVCEWAGVPLNEREAAERSREMAAMIDGSGAVGPRNWRGLRLRHYSERWAREVIDAVRAGRLSAPADSAVAVIAAHRDSEGKLLDRKTAAVELLNIIRPTVAVARYITFAVLALHEYPHCREQLLSGDDDYPELFAQEVRRFYPFFPAIGGRVQNTFNWRGQHFERGTWVLLDLYGTLHDPRLWENPDAFQPERFRHWDHSAFNLIPQGGGDHAHGHRCPGEWITLALLKAAVQLLTGSMRYSVPPQDLRVDLGRLPALPASGMVLSQVQHTH